MSMEAWYKTRVTCRLVLSDNTKVRGWWITEAAASARTIQAPETTFSIFIIWELLQILPSLLGLSERNSLLFPLSP